MDITAYEIVFAVVAMVVAFMLVKWAPSSPKDKLDMPAKAWITEYGIRGEIM